MKARKRPLFLLLLLLALLCSCAAPASHAAAPDSADSCTLTVRCDTLAAHLVQLDEDLAELVPADGCLLALTTVALEAGDTAFDVLQRTAQANRLPLEFSSAPLYNAVYVEGISGIYEFDGGPASGWTYCVNGVFPNVGMNQYTLQPGDQVSVLYTMDLGADVGNDYSEDAS